MYVDKCKTILCLKMKIKSIYIEKYFKDARKGSLFSNNELNTYFKPYSGRFFMVDILF